jgi:hypothetical protein
VKVLRALPIGWFAFAAFTGIVLLILVTLPAPHARALPPAGTDVFHAAGQVDVESRLGSETVLLTGTVTVQRGDPYMSGGVEVVDTEITSMSLSGQGLTGPITVVESPTLTSTGRIQSKDPPPAEYPASSYFDVFVRVTTRSSPSPTIQLSNTQAWRMTATSNVTAWPPVQATYASPAVYGVNNDGDGLLDEDSSDDDGDHAYDEDPIDGSNNDTDAFVNEDPALAQCTPALCDDDGDGAIDEDPACLPLVPTLPIGACVRSISITIYADTDGDGCSDEQELGPNELLGGRRNPQNPYDFYDVNGDLVVTVAADVLSVGRAYGSSSGPYYSPTLDRRLPPSAQQEPDPTKREPWDMGPPDGHISVPIDVLGVAKQFGHSCL